MKNKKSIIGIALLLVAFMFVGFLMLQFTETSGGKLIATGVLQLQKQIELLQSKLTKLLSDLNVLRKEKDVSDTDSDTVPPLLSNLEPEHMARTSGVVTWYSDELSDSRVNYSIKYIRRGVTEGTSVGYNSEPVTFHQVLLEDLRPNTRYYYFVTSTDSSGNVSDSNVHSITTLPY